MLLRSRHIAKTAPATAVTSPMATVKTGDIAVASGTFVIARDVSVERTTVR
jgi:hypothetical protein